METLYRKYRPQAFADLVGQDHVRTTLLNEIVQGSVGHAYLFTGPRGVGKTTTARLLAKAVNCLDRGGDGEPCTVCDACKEIAEGRCLDVIEMDAASHTGVDNVRDNIIEHVRFAPSLRRMKVFIIDEAHMLSTPAFNALLKTLEEPPAHALFILATTEIQKVLPTIISRCQRFDFRRIDVATLTTRLRKIVEAEKIKIDDDVLEAIAHRADGSQRDAESMLAQVMSLGGNRITLAEASLVLPLSSMKEVEELHDNLSRQDVSTALLLVDRLVDEGVDIKQFIGDVLEAARAKWRSTLAGSPSGFSVADLSQWCELLLEARERRSSILSLPLELAIVKFCGKEKKGIEGVEVVEGAKGIDGKLGPSTQPLQEIGTIAEVILPQAAGDHVTFSAVQGKWEEIFSRVAEAHTSLSFLLKSATLLGMDGDRVRLGFNFKFHAETMNRDKNRQAVETIMQNILGRRVLLSGEYVHADADVVVGQLVGALGGRTVE